MIDDPSKFRDLFQSVVDEEERRVELVLVCPHHEADLKYDPDSHLMRCPEIGCKVEVQVKARRTE